MGSCASSTTGGDQPYGAKGQVVGLWWKDKVIMNQADKDETLVPIEKNPVELVADIRKKMLAIKGESMSEDGMSVNYDLVKDSESFAQYKTLVKQLKFVELKELD